jgi:hypothetical protein
MAVVEHRDVIQDVLLRAVLGLVTSPMYQLTLQAV